MPAYQAETCSGLRERTNKKRLLKCGNGILCQLLKDHRLRRDDDLPVVVFNIGETKNINEVSEVLGNRPQGQTEQTASTAVDETGQMIEPVG